MRRAAFALVAAALGAGAWLLLSSSGMPGADATLRGAATPPPEDGPPPAVASALPPRTPAAPVSTPGGPPAALPPSLAGTSVDGGFVMDAAGHLVPTPDALALFDYFLAASGEEPEAAILARIHAEIARRLGPPAAGEAEALLAAYLAYRDDARELFERGGAGLSLERRIQRVRELRRAHFGTHTSAALFGEEEARWAVEIERRRVARDASLDDAERARLLDALEAELPPEVRASQAAALAALRLRQDEAKLRGEGAGAAEIQALREERFGPAAAARLAELDAARAAFAARMEEWRAARAALLAETPAAAQGAALEKARERYFAGPDLARVRALDRAEVGIDARE